MTDTNLDILYSRMVSLILTSPGLVITPAPLAWFQPISHCVDIGLAPTRARAVSKGAVTKKPK